ncbi:transglycosylase domain-containing protein [Streptomyces sp. NPDC092296]|uniref:transglycosylase domain-containing protein n=1 Tax=Streptomyces sp. NPDC092296 TaxID=3366012 RepID=UPI003804EC57
MRRNSAGPHTAGGAPARIHRAPRGRRHSHRLRIDYPRAGRRGVRRWTPSWRQWLAALLLLLGAAACVVGIAYARTGIPADLNAFATQQNNVYYWADGTEMARTGEVDRQEVPLDKVPAPVQNAVLAAENATFYSDRGVSPSGIGRAVFRMLSGGDTEGGSTITQQYVKNAYLDQRRTLSRKFTELFIAIKLDNRLTKQQILQGYLNTSWFGRGAYGIQRAAQAYYGKDVSQLNPSEGAFLAGLLKGAGVYDPALGPENHRLAVRRWTWVLDRMVRTGSLSAAERARYTVFPEPREPVKPAGLTGQLGYLVETARRYVIAHSGISDRSLDLGGYQIHTTFERPRTDALAEAVGRRLRQLAPAAHPGDRDVRVGAASVRPDGRIVALYGGPDYLRQGFNDADSTIVPVGTAFTPFVYAAALRDGVALTRDGPRTPVTPETVYNGDDSLAVRTPEGPYWDRSGKVVRAANEGGRSWGPIPLRTAVERSVSTPVIQLGMDVGLDRVRRAALDAGLLPGSMGEPVPMFALGNSTPSPIRLADAYAVFAAGGMHTEPYSVLRVSRGGTGIALPPPVPRRAFSAEVAGQVDQALLGAVRQGAARSAAVPGRRVAALPGAAQDGTAVWFAGYTKDGGTEDGGTEDGGTEELSTAVAVFRIDPRTQELLPMKALGRRPVSAGDYPAAVWADYLRADYRRTASAER